MNLLQFLDPVWTKIIFDAGSALARKASCIRIMFKFSIRYSIGIITKRFSRLCVIRQYSRDNIWETNILHFLRFFISQQICANKFVRDKTFGETPACPILKLILWHFFVKIHIFVIFAHFFEKSPQKSPCLGRLQN